MAIKSARDQVRSIQRPNCLSAEATNPRATSHEPRATYRRRVEAGYPPAEESYGVRADRQRKPSCRRCRPADAAPLAIRPRRADRHQVQLRITGRCVHRMSMAARFVPAASPLRWRSASPSRQSKASPDGTHPIQIAWKEFDTPRADTASPA